MTRSRWKLMSTALASSLMVTAVLAGCSGNNENNGTPSPSASQPSESTSAAPSESASAAAPTPDLTPITYTINTGDDKMNWTNPIAAKVTEKTGVSLKHTLTVGDQFSRWDLWLASNDYPDIVVLDSEYTKKYRDAGALIPLNDLIDQYGPHIKEKFGKYLNLLKDENGQIYSLYSVNKTEEATPDSQANFIIQYDVLKEAGYPEVKTFDQLYDLIKGYTDKHPEIDGKDTIGFGALMNSWTMKIAFNNSVINGSGLPDHGNYRIEDNGDVKYNPVTDDTKQYYAFLNKLLRAGLFDKEAFSMDEKAFQAKVAQGRVLAAYSPSWLLSDAEQSLRAAGHPERTYAHIPLYFDANVVDHSNSITATNAGNFQWGISKKAKNPERIIQFIDYLFTDEAQVLTQWGIEGEDYTVVDGKRVINPELVKQRITDSNIDYERGFKTISTGGSGYWFSIGNGAKLADGDYATPLTKDVIKAGYDDTTKEVLAKYGKEVWADFLPPATIVPGYLWQLSPPDATKVQEQKIDDSWRKHIPRIILSKDDASFEKAWSAFVAEIEKDGLQDVNAAYTKLWADFDSKFKAAVGE
ncbi:extracellular solute-binding protein [Cohnella yongneupensis]|uniref:Extracellular solute-binding protein n=1 Tax=Cohnella yongneupensis TaxID=425006 RepID=A0ABW0R391_9BACL